MWGGVAGVVLALGVAQALRSILFGAGPFDPVVFLLTPLGLFTVAVLASDTAARGATAVDPIETMRVG